MVKGGDGWGMVFCWWSLVCVCFFGGAFDGGRKWAWAHANIGYLRYRSMPVLGPACLP